MKKLFYDFETTGLNPNKNSVHHLYAAIEIDDKIIDEKELFIRPHPKAIIDPAALSAGNVTEEKIMSYIPQDVQFINFTSWLADYHNRFEKTDKIQLVGFNNRKFDDLFMEKWYLINSNNFMYATFDSVSLDVIVLAAEYLGERRKAMPSFKLHRVAKELGLDVDDSKTHSADYDVHLTRKIYRIVTNREIEL